MASYLLVNGLQLLLDSAVKSVAVMLAAWAVVAMLRRSSAAMRHWVWSAALVGLLMLPALSLMLPGWRIELLPSLAGKVDRAPVTSTPVTSNNDTEFPVSASTADFSKQVSAESSSQAAKLELDPVPATPIRSYEDAWPFPIPSMLKAYRMLKSFDWAAAALMFWGIGALLVVARLVAGTFRIWRLAKSASLVRQNSWLALAQALAARLRLRGGVELRKSEQVALPMTWGAWRAVVMLPAEADEWPQECRSIVLLHELAHVKRRDCLTQNLAQIACALYWFNPLVWLAVRQLHVERELACDDQVLEVGTKASEYASHLVEIARVFTASEELSPVAVGMACSQLESRVRSILDPGVRRRGLGRLSAGLIGAGAVCLVLSLAAVQPWGKATASPAEARAAGQVAAGEAGQRDLLAMQAQAEARLQTPKTQSGEATEAAADGRESREAEAARGHEASQDAPETDEQDGGQTKAQSSELTANQIIEMRSAGVTPEFIEAMRKQGFDNLTVREITQLSVHGVNADYIRQARSWGGDKLTVRDIVQLKIAGVTPEYIAAMKQAGYDGLTARQLAELCMHGVTPEFVGTMRRLGYDKLTASQLASLKIQGVDEAFVKEMQNWTGGKPSVNDLLQIKIHGVTPDFARQMKSLGYDNLPINKLTELKIHGVDEAFVKQMQGWRGGNPSIDELLQLKIHGVTPEFAQRMKAIGFDNLPLSKLTEMRIHGVDEKFVKEMRDLGFENLTVNQLIQMRIHGVDADYVKKMRAAGLKNVSVNQMIEMRATGIDAILLKEKVKEKR
jgi:beta-lactamase regulating signal transducer with metallopeptidase domain